ncbi:MAG: glycosyltransferase family 2 protein [Hyphomonadaceae bacterium]|nr:glycosyltransferase family 2 protein [Hyphomonadaceae bacterium]
MTAIPIDADRTTRSAPAPHALKIAVIAPCFNEEATIGDVVRGFLRALPQATVYVYDNMSTDATVDRARAAGAVVRRERARGKGNVVRRMLSDIEADIFVMIDGDNTYDAAAAPLLIQHLIEHRLDMVVGARRHASDAAYRRGHQFGNRVLTGVIATVFRADLKDMLSGYRVMSRRFVKSFPALSRGFEVETELTVHALEIGAAFDEVETLYRERPEGSASKLRTIRDGARIGRFIARLIREERPLEFFGALAFALIAAAAALAAPVLVEYMQTGLVPRLPTWVAATGLAVMSFFSLACGLILDTVTKGRREARRLAYLALPAPHDHAS